MYIIARLPCYFGFWIDRYTAKTVLIAHLQHKSDGVLYVHRRFFTVLFWFLD